MTTYPSRKVLVVDDDERIRSIIVNYVNSEAGYDVVGEAANGEEGVRLAAELHPEVIFMDLSMPVMGGVEAVKRIKAEQPGVRIVIVTIHQREYGRILVENLNVDGYVWKSSFLPDLREALKRLS